MNKISQYTIKNIGYKYIHLYKNAKNLYTNPQWQKVINCCLKMGAMSVGQKSKRMVDFYSLYCK